MRAGMLKVALIETWRDALFEVDLSSRRTSEPGMLYAAAIVVFIAALLRFVLADHPFHYDEWASIYFANLSADQLWGPSAVVETNPPLFYSILALWKSLGVGSVAGLRFVPIIAGVASIVLTAFVANRWLSRKAAVIATLLMCLSAQHIYYSQLLRGYILSLDGVILSIIGLLIIIHQRSRREVNFGWALHVAGSSLAIYSHTTMFLWPVVAAVALTSFLGRRLFEDHARLMVGLVASNLAILAITAWWLWITYLQLRGGAETIAFMQPISPREYLRQLLRTCLMAFDLYDRDKLATNVFLLLTIAASLAVWRDRTGRFLVILGLVSVVTFGIAGAFKPILLPRTIFWMSIFPILLISGGLAMLRSGYLRWPVVTVCASLLIANLVRQAPVLVGGADWQKSVASIARDRQALLLVQGKGMGSNVRQACLMEFHGPCPFPVVILQFDPSALDNPSWPGNSVTETPLRDLRHRIPSDRNVFALSNPGAEPFKALEIASGRQPTPGYKPFFEGPVAARELLAGLP